MDSQPPVYPNYTSRHPTVAGLPSSHSMAASSFPGVQPGMSGYPFSSYHSMFSPSLSQAASPLIDDHLCSGPLFVLPVALSSLSPPLCH